MLNKKITGLGGTGGGGPGANYTPQTMQIPGSGHFDGSEGQEQVYKEDEQQPQASSNTMNKQFNFNKSTTKNQPAVLKDLWGPDMQAIRDQL